MKNEDRDLYIKTYMEINFIEWLIDNYERVNQVPPDLQNIIATLRDMLNRLKPMVCMNLQTLAFQTLDD